MRLLVVTVAVGMLSCCLATDPIVEVEQGFLQGKQESGASGTAPYYAFRRIPYATAPLGELRFRAPRPPKAYGGVRNATVEGSICTQPTLTGQLVGSEDCLFLNVYTPEVTCSSTLPVLVFFHSSAFFFGDGGSGWYGPDFINYNKVILVTANYRLGPMGFVNLDTPGAPGNAGFKDTLAVLKWVKKNIKSFCGNADKVTVGGHSAGAMMSHVHVLNAKSQGYFQRALLMSGNALTTVCHTDAHIEAAQELATLLGAKDNSTATVERTLKAATGDQINAAYLTMLMNEPHPNGMFKFGMSSEKSAASESDLAGSTLLTTAPEVLVRKAEVSHPVPILTGTAAQETTSLYAVGTISKAIAGNESALLQRVNDRFVEILQRMALRVPEAVAKNLGVASGAGTADQQKEVLQLVRNQYAGGNTTFTREQYNSITSGMEFFGPLLNYLRLCRGDVYLYESDALTDYNFIRQFLQVPYASSTMHADDLGWVFRPNVVDLHQNYTGTGLAPSLLRFFTIMITEFVKGKTVGPRAACGEASLPYIHINGSSPVMGTNFGSSASLWKRVFDMRRSK